MTEVTVRRVGSSLGFTIPSSEAKRLGLHPGDRVDVQIQKVPDIKTVFGLLAGRVADLDGLMRDIDKGAD